MALYYGSKKTTPIIIKEGYGNSDGSVVETVENFTIVGEDVRIDQNSIASDFSETSWIEPIFKTSTIGVDNLIIKLRADDFSNSFQIMLYGFIHLNYGYFGMWGKVGTQTSDATQGVRNIIEQGEWYWVQVVLNSETNTYNQYILKDDEKKYTLDSLPNINEWTLIVSNVIMRMDIPIDGFIIGNNNTDYASQYFRGDIDLNCTKITLTDGTVWTPYSKKSTPTVSGDTTWVYTNEQTVAGDKVMITKVNSLVTPDDAFCNGFRPSIIMNGYAYGREGEQTNTKTLTQRRQIVNGVIDSDNYETISMSSMGYNFYPHYCLKGESCVLQHLTSSTNFVGQNTCYFVDSTTKNSMSVTNKRSFHLENLTVGMTSSSGSTGTPYVYDYATKSSFNLGSSRNFTNLAWEDGTPNCFYTFTGNNWTSSLIFRKNTISTKTTEDITPMPNVVITGTNQATTQYAIFLQTKDYKYLLHSGGYVDVTLKNNTITINDYPPIITNAIGDRAIRQMQVFYDGYFCFQLEDGVTLMCKYDNDMSDVRIDEVVEPIYVEGDDTVYLRSYSADRLYWWQFPIYRNTTYEVMPLSNNPAGAYKAKETTSDYMAFRPSKDRFNSTVLTGFTTGNTKTEDGRLMIEVKTVLE